MKLFVSVIAATLLAACGAKSSDEEQVRALIDSVETAAEARDASDVLEHVADDYADSSGLDKAQLQNFLRGYFLVASQARTAGEHREPGIPGRWAGAGRRSASPPWSWRDPDMQRLKVEFRRAGGEWRVVRADRVGR